MVGTCSLFKTLWLQHNPEAEKDVRGAVDWLVTLQTYEGNFPCAMGDLKEPRHYSEELVHWCHGAPGTVYLLARWQFLFQTKPSTSALIEPTSRGAEKRRNTCRPWWRPPTSPGEGDTHLNPADPSHWSDFSSGVCSRKVPASAMGSPALVMSSCSCIGWPGVCSGGFHLFDFLTLRNKMYLNRAFKYAEFLFSDTFRSARTPDSPLSLYEGWSGDISRPHNPLKPPPGTVCFLADLLHPDQAAFPFSEVFYWSSSQSCSHQSNLLEKAWFWDNCAFLTLLGNT